MDVHDIGINPGEKIPVSSMALIWFFLKPSSIADQALLYQLSQNPTSGCSRKTSDRLKKGATGSART
jgi:hypothetical protein